MFLLLLMGLGAAGVKAQVRIGGNAAPNASAVLDLNATDATMNGTKGLALPRVDLTSPTMLLSGVTSNLTGMMVYNTTATLGRIGIYYWNGASWVNASLPTTSAADSGKYLYSNGVTWSSAWISPILNATTASLPLDQPQTPVTWYWILTKTVAVTLSNWGYVNIPAPGILETDICFHDDIENALIVTPSRGGIQIYKPYGSPVQSFAVTVNCFRHTP